MDKYRFNFFIRPILIAITLAGLWYLLKLNGFIFNTDFDTEILSSGTISSLGIFYTLVYAFVLATVWNQFLEVEESIKVKDKESFIRHKDKRIPLPIKLLLFVFSILILGAFFISPFKNSIIGFYSVFAVALGLSMNWSVIVELDHPFEGIWNLRIPCEWKNINDKGNPKLLKTKPF
ncbi:MAG: hypothetical protein PHT54_03345 [Candidatus Nanoarchaeia archaeon]|nr:hypothetical protein [Candidatus Nanoarchaeia archaeon]